MRRLAASIVVLSLLAAACSTLPSEGRVRSQVVAALTVDGLDKIYDIENFQVLSGQMQSDGTYQAKVRYDIVLKKGITSLPRQLEVNPKLVRIVVVLGGALARAALSGKIVMVGTHIPVEQDAILVNEGHGWVFRMVSLGSNSDKAD